MSKHIAGSTAFVTGSNRGIGFAIAEALLERGARRVYAAARRPESLQSLVERWGDRVVPVALDVTDAEQVAAAAAIAGDVDLLVNNAGVAGEMGGSILDEGALETARWEMEVNYFGLLQVSRALAPALQANAPGAVVNIASVAGLVNFPFAATYSVSKAAAHSTSQALRVALGDGVRVSAVYPGPVDTDMAADVPMEKTSAAEVAHAILDVVDRRDEEIFPDPMSAQMGAAYGDAPKAMERNVVAMAAAG